MPLPALRELANAMARPLGAKLGSSFVALVLGNTVHRSRCEVEGHDVEGATIAGGVDQALLANDRRPLGVVVL